MRAKGVVLGFLAGAVVGGATYGLVVSPTSEPGPSRPAPSQPIDAPEAFEPRDVPGIKPPSHYVETAREQVADALARVAEFEQRFYERTGEYAPFSKLWTVTGNPRVTILEMKMEPTAVCIEAAHAEVPGARLRFISVTGQIDAGSCDQSRPLAEQVGDDPAAQSGGHMKISDVRLVERPAPRSAPHLGKRYVLLFDAEWEGAGLPEQQLCWYHLVAADGRAFHSGEWGFGMESERIDDYRGVTFFGEADLEGEIPVDVELDCRNNW